MQRVLFVTVKPLSKDLSGSPTALPLIFEIRSAFGWAFVGQAGDADAVNYMHKFLGRLMWRSTKLLVKDELNLPPQEERLSWLRFSPVEAHFYRQQHEKCAVKAREMIAKYGRQRKQHGNPNAGRPPVSRPANAVPSAIHGDQTNSVVAVGQDGVGPTPRLELPEETNGTQTAEEGSVEQTSNGLTMPDENMQRNSDADSPLSVSESSVLSTSLLRLRQACCHPQVGSAGIRSLQQRTPMTMDQILQVSVVVVSIVHRSLALKFKLITPWLPSAMPATSSGDVYACFSACSLLPSLYTSGNLASWSGHAE